MRRLLALVNWAKANHQHVVTNNLTPKNYIIWCRIRLISNISCRDHLLHREHGIRMGNAINLFQQIRLRNMQSKCTWSLSGFLRKMRNARHGHKYSKL